MEGISELLPEEAVQKLKTVECGEIGQKWAIHLNG
jgi:hypothetical protein